MSERVSECYEVLYPMHEQGGGGLCRYIPGVLGEVCTFLRKKKSRMGWAMLILAVQTTCVGFFGGFREVHLEYRYS